MAYVNADAKVKRKAKPDSFYAGKARLARERVAAVKRDSAKCAAFGGLRLLSTRPAVDRFDVKDRKSDRRAVRLEHRIAREVKRPKR